MDLTFLYIGCISTRLQRESEMAKNSRQSFAITQFLPTFEGVLKGWGQEF
jgi:hypothetical protein